MLNGTFEVLDIKEDIGCQVNYNFKNEKRETFGGGDYINAQWMRPLATLDFELSWFSQTTYNYLTSFFVGRSGSENVFLFKDPLNNYAPAGPNTQQPYNYDTGYGIRVRGMVVQYAGRYQLAKRYTLFTSLGNYTYDKIITHPQEGTIQFWAINLGVEAGGTVNYDTGEVTPGPGLLQEYCWSGYFYTPFRIENDTLPMKFIVKDYSMGSVLYNLPTFKLIEVKEDPLPYSQTLALAYDHHWGLTPSVGFELNQSSFTDIYTAESGYETRDNYRNTITEVVLPPQNINFDGTDRQIEYILGLYHLCLGDCAHFFFTDTDSGTDDEFRFTSALSFSTVSDFSTDYHRSHIVELGSLTLKEDEFSTKSTFCYLWQIVRTDSTSSYSTNHDRNIVHNSNTYSPVTSYTSTSPSRTSELNADTSEIASVFNASVTHTDLITDKFKNAQITISIYNWLTNSLFAVVYKGNIASYSVGYLLDKPRDYQFDLVSQSAKLDVKRVVKTSSSCRVKFLSQGTNQCNRTIDGSVQTTSTVTGANSAGTIFNIFPPISTSYAYGTARFTSGLNNNVSVYITAVVNAGLEIQLLYPLPFVPQFSDTVSFTKGCGKQVADCASFSNTSNFRGEPRLPNIDNLANTAQL